MKNQTENPSFYIDILKNLLAKFPAFGIQPILVIGKN